MRHSVKTYVLWTIATTLFLAGLCLLLVPTFLSTRLGTDILVQAVNRKTGYEISIGDLSLSLFGKQSAHAIQVADPKKAITLKCTEIASNQGLLKILFSHDVGLCQVSNPTVYLRHSLAHTALGKKISPQKAGFIPCLEVDFQPLKNLKKEVSGSLCVSNGTIEVNSTELGSIIFTALNLQLDLPREEDLFALKLKGNTEQDKIQGTIDVDMNITDLKKECPSISIHANTVALPLKGVDQIVSLLYPQAKGLLLNGIGPSLDMELEGSLAQDRFALNWKIHSANLNSAFKAEAQNGVVTLSEPARLELLITPSFVKAAQLLSPALTDIALVQPTTFSLALDQLKVPLSEQGLDFQSLQGKGSVSLTPATELSINKQLLVISQWNTAFSCDPQLSSLNLKGSALFNLGNNSSDLTYQGSLLKWWTDAPTGSCDLKLHSLPSHFLSQAFMPSIALTDYLGSTVGIDAHIDIQEKQTKADITLSSPNVEGLHLQLNIDQGITLIEPVNFTYTLNPTAVSNPSIELTQPVPIACTLARLNLPNKKNINQLQLALGVAGKQFFFSRFFKKDAYQIENLEGSLNIDTLDKIALSVKANPLDLTLGAGISLQEGALSFTKPLLVNLTLSDALLKSIMPLPATLAAPAQLCCRIDPFTPTADLNHLKLQGSASIAEIVLSNLGRTKSVTLKIVQVPFSLDAAAKKAQMQFSSQVLEGQNASGSIQATVALSDFSLSPELSLQDAQINASCDLQNISSSLIDMTLSKGSISTLIGPQFQGKLKVQSLKEKQLFSLQFTSDLINIDTAFVIDDHEIQLQGNAAQINWTLNPAGYRALDAQLTKTPETKLSFDLKEPTTFNLKLSDLHLPCAASQEKEGFSARIPQIRWDFGSLELHAQGKNTGMNFLDLSSQEKIKLSNLAFSMDKSIKENPLSFQLNAEVSHQSSTLKNSLAKTGSIAWSGSLLQPLNTQGEADLKELSLQTSLKVFQFPSRALDLLARFNGNATHPFSTIFGETINADLTSQVEKLSGPFSLNINSPNTRASIVGKLSNGTFLLDQPIYVQAVVTPEISRLFLKEINPLSISSIYSQNPVTLEIPSEQFSLPIYPFDLKKINVPQARMELGRISCHNEGNINIALSLLKSKQFEKDKDLTLWFAPIDLHIQEGIVDLERTEILLADTFDIAIWGKVDMVQDDVDMVLGLTADTLYKAFGIKQLPADYVLLIPMKGKANDVQINTGNATAKVALLMAWQKGSSTAAGAAGGTAGAILGGLLNKVVTLPDQNAKVPPAKRPFPWESGKKSRKKETSSEEELGKKRHFKKKESPLKQILKVIK